MNIETEFLDKHYGGWSSAKKFVPFGSGRNIK